MDWKTFDIEQLVVAINKALNDENVKDNLKKMHDLFVDKRDHPIDTALWWVEYVIRHGGTDFLKPHSLDLPWYQYHLLDIIAFILMMSVLGTFLVVKLSIKCFHCICSRKQKTE